MLTLCSKSQEGNADQNIQRDLREDQIERIKIAENTLHPGYLVHMSISRSQPLGVVYDVWITITVGVLYS